MKSKLPIILLFICLPFSAFADEPGEFFENRALYYTTLGEQKVELDLNVDPNYTYDFPFTADHVNDSVFHEIDSLIRIDSCGLAWLSGPRIDWIQSEGLSHRDTIISRGYDISGARRTVYAGNNEWGLLGGGSRWVGGSGYVDFQVGAHNRPFLHEFGHSMGLMHSDGLVCGSVSITSELQNCTAEDYGGVGPMGRLGDGFSAFQKEQLGWIVATVANVSDTYNLGRSNDPSSSIKALKIPLIYHGKPYTFYIENQWLYSYQDIDNVAGLHVFISIIQPWLNLWYPIELVLNASPEITWWVQKDLKPGRTFTDPMSGVSIQLLSVNSDNTQVSITFPPDSVAPTVSMPNVSGSVVSGKVQLTPVLDDNIGVAHLQLYADDALVDERVVDDVPTNTVYPDGVLHDKLTETLTWDTKKLAVVNGPHTLQIKVRDYAGNIGTTPVMNVTLNNQPFHPFLPDIVWPQEGEVLKGNQVLNWNEQRLQFSNTTLYRCQFPKCQLLIDGKQGFVHFLSYWMEINPFFYPEGPHTLTVRAFDASGNMEEKSVHVVFDHQIPPQVSFVSPTADQSLDQNVTVSVAATDTSGVAKVEFFRDGVLMGSRTSPPYEFNWDTRGERAGVHQLDVVATDIYSNKGSASEAVFVRSSDIQAPIIQRLSPLDSDVVGQGDIVQVWLEAQDNTAVSKIELSIDGTPVGTTTHSRYLALPWTCSSAGPKQFVAKAYDPAGNVSTLSFSWIVAPAGTDRHMAVGPFQLNLDQIGEGTVDVNVKGENCGDNCFSFPLYQRLTITPHPASGYRFAGWSGDCAGWGKSACTLGMLMNREATANFAFDTPPRDLPSPKNFHLTAAP